MLGIATGDVGMSRADFSACTPSQFSLILKFHRKKQESKSRESWEQTRFLACVLLQPHSKKNIQPRDVVVFGWEQQKESPNSAQGRNGTKEDFEAAKKTYGL